MFTSMIIIAIHALVAEINGALNVPEWLDNAYEFVCDFWEKILP